MNKYAFSIEKDVPAIGTSILSDKDSIISLLDSRIEALSSIENELKAQKDFVDAELLAANEIRRLYKTMKR